MPTSTATFPVAVVRTCLQLRTTPSTRPHHDDYVRVNPLLDAAEQVVRESFEHGAVLAVDQRVAPVENVVGNWSINEARTAAWTNAEVLWRLRRMQRVEQAYLDVLDGTVGL